MKLDGYTTSNDRLGSRSCKPRGSCTEERTGSTSSQHAVGTEVVGDAKLNEKEKGDLVDQVKTEFSITPQVDQAQEFVEIANDFADPLDLVREAISNAFDAQAKEMQLDFSVVSEYGESVLVIDLQDDGTGMTQEGLQAFFDLGNSLRRADTQTIGEKGHGTKVYFNSHRVEVWTRSDDVAYYARLDNPFRRLCDREIPEVHVKQIPLEDVSRGTRIVVRGYNNNRRDRFTHNILKDHILWFTKFGDVEVAFQEPDQQHPTLWLERLS